MIKNKKVVVTSNAGFIYSNLTITFTKKEIKYKNLQTRDIKHFLADISKVKEKINYRPQLTLIDDLNDTLTWFQKKFEK